MSSIAKLSEDLIRWREDAAAPSVAVLVGYDDTALGRALALDQPNLYTMFCDKAYADWMTRCANEALKSPPRFRMANRYRQDLTSARARAAKRVLITPFAFLVAQLLNATQRVGRQIETMFGVPENEDRIAAEVLISLRGFMKAFCEQTASRLVLSDPGGDFLRFSDDLVHLIIAEDFDPEAVGDFAAARLEDDVWTARLENRLSARAAHVVDAPEEALRGFLDPGASDGVIPALALRWGAEFRRLAETTSSAPTAETASSAADRIAAVLESA